MSRVVILVIEEPGLARWQPSPVLTAVRARTRSAMSTLQAQIDALTAALQWFRSGEVQAFTEVPAMLDELRRGVTDLERRQAELASLYEVGQEIVSMPDLDRLLASILGRAIVLVGAERGFLVLCNPDQKTYQVAVARHFAQGEIDNAQIEISQGIIRRVLDTREPVITTNAQVDPRFQASHSIVAYQIRSVLAVPLAANEELIGAIYVDTRLAVRLFGESDLALLSAMANQAAVAIQMARLYQDLQARNRELGEALRDLKKAQDELLQAERLSLVGRMAASIIHDIKHPLTNIKGYASLLGDKEMDPESRKHFADIIVRSVDTFVEMTQEILDYARGGGVLEPIEIPVDAFIGELLDLLADDFAQKGLILRQDLAYTGTVKIDPVKMRRALYNIAINARDVMAPGGTLTISTQAVKATIEIRLSDTGPGIPAEIRNSLFEPFVTFGKPTGTGLGLAIARKTAQDHGGTIAVDSIPGQGATFVIRLPRTQLSYATKSGAIQWIPPKDSLSSGRG
jgi:two-component system sensor histidine kinase HydH